MRGVRKKELFPLAALLAASLLVTGKEIIWVTQQEVPAPNFSELGTFWHCIPALNDHSYKIPYGCSLRGNSLVLVTHSADKSSKLNYA